VPRRHFSRFRFPDPAGFKEAVQKTHPDLEQRKLMAMAMTLSMLADRIRRHRRQHGSFATLRFLSSRVFRRREHVVFDVLLDGIDAPRWEEGEQLRVIGPENIDAEVTPAIRGFMGGDEAVESLQGVRNGDRLFVVTGDGEVLHGGYVLFHTRQTKLIGEPGDPPVIASCLTAPAARGRGLYRKALRAELCYLRDRGYRRAVIETSPDNTASRRGIEAAGFRFLREARVWIVMNKLVCQRLSDVSGTHWRVFLL
jgi:hypothetical protein